MNIEIDRFTIAGRQTYYFVFSRTSASLTFSEFEPVLVHPMRRRYFDLLDFNP